MAKTKKTISQAMDRRAYIIKKCLQEDLVSQAYVDRLTLSSTLNKTYDGFTPKILNETIAFMARRHQLVVENDRIYLAENYRYEKALAGLLADLQTAEKKVVWSVDLPETIEAGSITLCPEQREAVELALSNKVSVISGGAGTGKSTIIQAILDQSGVNRFCCVLAAPTGKAARVLQSRAHWEARTVHSALGTKPNEDFLKPVKWEAIGLVIIDEASMVDLGMMAGILLQVLKNPWCRLVLLGDLKQLPSVGPGTVLQLLHKIGVPTIELTENHRLTHESGALVRNIIDFEKARAVQDLDFDDSFEIHEVTDADAARLLVEDAADRYTRGESVQVLSPRNASGALSARTLNGLIQARINPARDSALEIKMQDGRVFRDGDRVIITQNDREMGVVNGDVGILRLEDVSKAAHRFSDEPHYDWRITVELPDGHNPCWLSRGTAGFRNLDLAYCLTTHKAQGSEWDNVLLALSDSMGLLRYRGILYTSISRAREKVVIYGSRQAIDASLHREPPPRNCALEERFDAAMEEAAKKKGMMTAS